MRASVNCPITICEPILNPPKLLVSEFTFWGRKKVSRTVSLPPTKTSHAASEKASLIPMRFPPFLLWSMVDQWSFWGLMA